MTIIPIHQYTVEKAGSVQMPAMNSPILEVGPVRGACGKRYIRLRIKHVDHHSAEVVEVDFDALAQAMGFSTGESHGK